MNITRYFIVVIVSIGIGFFGLRLGTVSQRNQFTPKRQIWKRSALNWTSALETNLDLDKQ
mgnify:CR=1 FL=1